jgi:hypothetical protein
MAALKAQQDAAAAALAARVKQSTLDANTAKLPGEQADAFQKVLKPYSAAAYNSQTVDEGVASVNAMYDNPSLAAVLTKIKPREQAIADTTAAFANPKTMSQWQAHWGGITPEKLFDSVPKPRQPDLAADLLIPGPDGTLVPNTALVGVKTQLARESRPPRPEAAPRTQQVTMSDGTLGIMNMDTGAITPSTLGGARVKGKPSAFAEKTAAQQKQLGKDLEFAITQLTDITKDGGLIDQSTGSGAGQLIDVAAAFGGKAMPGAIAAGKLKPIADLALKLIPRFEGPQSNADTKSYKEASGQLADTSLPNQIRKEAGRVVLGLVQARKNQFVTRDMVTEGAPAAGGVVDFGSLK